MVDDNSGIVRVVSGVVYEVSGFVHRDSGIRNFKSGMVCEESDNNFAISGGIFIHD